jgi:hypothetical protein
MSPAGLQLFTTMQRENVLTPWLWLEVTDLIKVDDGRSVDPDKALCAE